MRVGVGIRITTLKYDLAGQTRAMKEAGGPANQTSLSDCWRNTSDDHGWSSVTEAKDGERGPVFRPANESIAFVKFGYCSIKVIAFVSAKFRAGGLRTKLNTTKHS